MQINRDFTLSPYHHARARQRFPVGCHDLAGDTVGILFNDFV